ncbi:MAG TPA: GH92 family glycosyl hydrolase [Acidobacteriaceae bacterium]|nr:GH92 family glycosyl hydrolase [Acidobacteriaceae bacterium]
MTKRLPLGRRDFLKSSAAVIVGVALDNNAADAQQAGDDLSTSPPSSANIGNANPLQGTNSTYRFSRGNTLPIAALPFGMAHWTLQSAEGTAWMFDPSSRRLQGFRCTHQLSPWLADYGHAVFLPCAGAPKLDAESRSSSWRPEQARLQPFSFELELMRYQIDAELVPTERCALISSSYHSKETPGFIIEVPGHDVTFQQDSNHTTIRFQSRSNHGGVPENFATYYIVQFDQPWEHVQTLETSAGTAALISFGDAGPRKIAARIATSFISYEQCARNLAAELGSQSVDQNRERAEKQWDSYANRIEITGGTDHQRKTFYSCLYRALLFPHTWHEFDASGQPQHFSPYDGKVHTGVMYADHGYWDVYRAWYPLMSILWPEKLGEILESWVNAYREGGWLPQFPCPGYRACMTGSLIDAVFGDAAAKGIPGFDLKTAYEGLKKHATQPGDPEKGYGRRGIESYLKLGYVPVESVSQSVAETVDAAYGDFCISQVATALGQNDDARMFLERSRNWRRVFDPKTGFFRGKHEDGTWLEPFDEFQWGSPYVEGSAWQHRWDAPHEIAALISQMGGQASAVAALDRMLSLPPTFHVGVYGQEIHEMSEMAAVDFGQYAQSNQPVHHLLYIYAVASRPDRTQYWVRQVLNKLYSPDDFPGDEDTGSMAAWYILSAIGFYPLCPGKAEYVFGSPLFEKVTLHLPMNKTLEIEARDQSETAVYVSSLTVNGTPQKSPYLPHETVMRGGRIEFSMQDHPLKS